MSENLVGEHRRFVERLAGEVGFRAEWRDGVGLDGVDLAWSCGLPLSLRGHEWSPTVAPVMIAERYLGMPVYFTDLVVDSDHPAEAFSDLAGVPLVMNEPVSHSGHASVRYELRRRGLDLDFFGGHRFSGGHIRSLQAVMDGSGEVAALDSVMFDSVKGADPDVSRKVKTIASIGPWPTPPLAVRTSVGVDLVDAITRAALLFDLPVPGVDRLVQVDMDSYLPLAENWNACCIQ